MVMRALFLIFPGLLFSSLALAGDKPLPCPLFPDLCRKAASLIEGTGRENRVIPDLDRALREPVVRGDIEKMSQLFFLRRSSELFVGLDGRNRETALLLFQNFPWGSRFLQNFDDRDDLGGALGVLGDLHSAFPDALGERFEFCLAFSLVWDDSFGHDWAGRRRGFAQVSVAESFRHFVDNESLMRIKPGALPCEMSVFVVGSRLLAAEREWVLKSYGTGDLDAPSIFNSVPWTLDRDLTLAHGRGPEIPYTMKNIRQTGGCCMEKAFFTENACRLFGVPAALVTGRAGTGHCGIGVLQGRPGERMAWDFEAARCDRVSRFNGIVMDPTDAGGFMTEAEVELAGDVLNGEDALRRIGESHLFLQASLWAGAVLPETFQHEGERYSRKRIRHDLLERSLDGARGNVKAWRLLSRLASAGEMSEKRALSWAVRLIALTLEDYPDFTVERISDLIGCVGNRLRKKTLFEKMYKSLDRDRPDLVCLLKIAEGRDWLACDMPRKALDCFIHPLVHVPSNATVIDSAFACLRTTESLLEDKRPAIKAYGKIFDSVAGIPRPGRLIIDLKMRLAGRLFDLYTATGDLKNAARYKSARNFPVSRELRSAFGKLRHTQLAEQREFLERAADIDSLETRGFLRQCASDGFTSEVRCLAFRLFALSCRESQVVDYLIEQRGNPSFSDMVALLPAMEGLDAFPVLAAIFNSLEDQLQKLIVARTVAAVKTDRAFSFLKSRWERNKHGNLGMPILEVVLAMESPPRESFLNALIKEDEQAYARYLGIRKAVKSFGDKYAGEAGRLLAQDLDIRVRRGALESLARLGTEAAVRAVYSASAHEDVRYVHEMVAALRTIPPDRVRSAIPDDWFETKSRSSFLCAALTLAHLGERSIVPRLKRAGKARPEDLFAVTYALSLLGEDDRGFLRLMVRGKDSMVWERFHEIGTLRLKSEAGVEKLISVVRDSRSEILRIKATLVLGLLQAGQALDVVAGLLKSRSRDERIAAIRALGAMQDSRAVPLLIEAIPEEENRCLDEINWSLFKLTGRDFGFRHEVWAKWWQGSKQTFEPAGDPAFRKPLFDQKSLSRARYTFYGLVVRGHGEEDGRTNVIFLLDISGSMAGKPLDDLKKNFLTLLDGLDSNHKVNVFVFSSSRRKWKPDLVSLSDKGTKLSLSDFIKCLRTEMATNLYDPLAEALNDKQVNRIIVLTDGVPTTGKYTTGHVIVEKITHLNRSRQVRIDTIALGAADRDFLRNLAEQNGGKAISVEE